MTEIVKNSTMDISEFKAKCLSFLDEVAEKGNTLIGSKRGRPIARVEPVAHPKRSLRGNWKGIVRVKGEVLRIDTSEDWEALE